MILRKAEPADVAVLTGISDSALRADATAAQRSSFRLASRQAR